ncbi:MAG: phage portal protein [Lactobacillus helveticus]
MANFFGKLFSPNKDKEDSYINAFNKAFYEFIGGQSASYDHDRETYIKQGYGTNPDVFAIVNQQADKFKSVPYEIRKIKDEKNLKKLSRLEYATKGNLSLIQRNKFNEIKANTYKDSELEMPIEHPNANQTWADVFSLFEVFMQTTGNFFLYMATPTAGANVGEPQEVYVLPSHLMKIVLKEDADLSEMDNVIDYYMLTKGNQYAKFNRENVMHIKYANPFFDFDGSHLYGMSPMRVLLKNIESSNDALDQNVKTMKNGGVFGFITAKDKVLNAEQANQIKQRMQEMDKDRGRLSKIAGLSVPVEFTKLSLNTDELKPFDYLKYDQKTIANVLQWSDKLLNNDEGAKYDNLKVAERQVFLNHIIPNLKLFEESFNKEFIQKYKKYKNTYFKFDYTDMPEMQMDLKDMTESYSRAPITPNEFREVLNLPRLEDEGMDAVWIEGNKRRIDEAALSEEELLRAFGDE